MCRLFEELRVMHSLLCISCYINPAN
uniref:Uncharacterized protein n=1 Tax=Anguilla anguilla TaxID=7936 RepID=A0A0E9XYJ0_ANGAN